MPNVTCVPKDSTALGTPSRRKRSCAPGTSQREAYYLNEDHERGLPVKLDDETHSDDIVADSVSLGSLLDADETASQDQGKASSGLGTRHQGSRLMTPRMSGSAHHQHHHQ